MPHVSDRHRPLNWLVGLIAVVAAIWLLRAASIVAIPVAAACFVALVVYPVQQYLQRRIPHPSWAGLALTMALLAAVVGGTIWGVAAAIDEAVDVAPQYEDRARQHWEDLEQWARESPLPLPVNLLDSVNLAERLGGMASSFLRTSVEIASGMVLVFFLVLLILIELPVWQKNAGQVMSQGHDAAMLESVAGIAEKVRGYLHVRTVLGLASAAAAGIWLLLLDVDLVLIWVALTVALNYIPNIGSIIAVIPPSLMAILQHGPLYGLLTLAGLTVIEQIIGNYIDPRMQGRRLQISPVLVLVAVVFWSWMWGPVGALLGVPITVVLLATASRVSGLKPLAAMLTPDPEEQNVSNRRSAA